LKLTLRIAIAAAACAAAAGCWPWHQSETPQQRFIEALNRGESAQASQIWLRMSTEDKIKFAHGEGMAPGTTPEDVKKLVLQHHEKGDEGGESEGGSETVESLGTNIGGAGLHNLPGLTEPSQAAPPAPPGN
jgi:hypothetical protein